MASVSPISELLQALGQSTALRGTFAGHLSIDSAGGEDTGAFDALWTAAACSSANASTMSGRWCRHWLIACPAGHDARGGVIAGPHRWALVSGSASRRQCVLRHHQAPMRTSPDSTVGELNRYRFMWPLNSDERRCGGSVRAEGGRHAHLDLLTRAWQLRENVTAYDAVYIALAEALDATVITCDAPMAKAPGHRARIETVE